MLSELRLMRVVKCSATACSTSLSSVVSDASPAKYDSLRQPYTVPDKVDLTLYCLRSVFRLNEIMKKYKIKIVIDKRKMMAFL